MIGVTNDYKRLVALDGRRWKARVAVSNKTFEDDQIVNLVLDEATMKGESFEVGSVVSNKLTLEILNNELLTYDNVTVVPTLSLEVGASFEDVPLGTFKVADYKRDRHKVTLTCYDDMSALEFGYFPTTNPTSVANHVAQIRASSGVDLVGVFPADVVEMPLGLTYREAVGYIAAYMGGFARFNRAGKLEIRGYTGSVTEVAASYVAQAQDLQSALEYLPALEMAAAIDERELQPLIIEFELRTTETAPVLIYSLGKHSIGAWVATAGMDWQRFSIAVAPEVANAALSNTTLSFYAIYGTGIAVSARSLKVKVADGPGIDYGAYNFKVVDGAQYHSLQLAEKDVTIGKVTGQVGDELVTIGSLGHEVTIDCPFLTQARLQQLYDQLKAIRYRPYDIRAFRGDPAMEAGDQIALIDEFGVQHNTVVTHQQIRYASSVSHQLRAKGLSEKAASMQPKSKVDKAFTKIYAEQLAVKEALIGKATIQQLDAWIANVTELYATTAYVDNATVNFLTATDADIKYATIQNLTAVDGKFDDLSSVYASIVQLDAISGHITDLQTAQASIQTALVGKLDAVDVTADYLKAKLSELTTAWITNAMIDTASVNRLMIDQTNIKSAAILDAYVKNLNASVITTGFLNAGRIATNSISLDKLESGISGKLGIVAQDEITLQITGAVNDLSVGGGENLTPGLGNLHGLEIVSWSISSVMDGAARAFSFDLMASRATEVLVYSKGDYEIGNWYLNAGTTSKRYGVGGKPKKVANTGVTTLYFYAVYKSGVSLTVANRKAESGSVVTGLDMGAYVPKTGVKTAISLSQEGVRITGKHLKIDALTTIDEAVIKSLHIADTAITTAKIADLSVSSAKIQAEAVDTSKIKDLSVTSAKIAVAAIGTTQIADASITNAKIVELSAAKVTTGTLSVERLEIRGSTKSIIYEINNISGALQSQNVETINGEALTPRSITADRIVAHEITANEIAARAITANEMALNTITATSGIIADAAIISAKIADAAITNAKIDRATTQRLVVVTADIKDAAIETAKIKDLSVTDAKIASIQATKIIADWLESGHIKAGALTTNVISSESWANLDLSSNSSIRLAVKVNTNNMVDGSADKSGLEYLAYMDIKDVVTTGLYTLSFDLDVSKPGPVLLYSLGRWNIGQHAIVQATPGRKRYAAILEVVDGVLTAATSMLSFHRIYGSGMSLTVGKVMIAKGAVAGSEYYPPVDYDVIDKKLAAITLAGDTVSIDGRWLHITAETMIDAASIDMAAIKNLVVTSAQIQSVNASTIDTGTLNAARIGANTITANHLAADVGKSLDLTSNTSITLAVMQGIDNAYALRPSRNLIQNGAFEDAWDKWTSGVGNQTLGYAAGIKRQFVSHGGGTMDGYPLSSRFTLTAGKTYTLSFRFMGTSGAYITPIIYDQTEGEVMRRGYTIPTQPEAWGSYFSHTFTPTATVSNAYVMMTGTLPTTGYLYVTEFQLEEGSERMYYERNYNGKTGGLAAAINMDEEGVRITGDKVSITGRTYIQDAVITSAKISDAAITTAKIDNLAVTDAKIESLSANKIKTGILKALVGDSYINLETGVFSFVNATFESSVGATKRVEIKEGAVFSTDGTVHARLSQGQLHLFDNTNENSTSSTKLSVRTGLGICFNSGQIGFDNASSWSWGNYSGSRLGASDVSPSWTEEKTHIYSAIFEASSTYSLAAGSTAVKYVQVPSSIDLRSLGGVFVQALEGGIICTLGSNPYRSGSGGNLIELRITYRNVTDAAISTTKFRTSLMIIKRM